MTVLTQDFGNLSSFVDLSDVFPAGSDANPMYYFANRGYTADVNIRAAPYDWRLGASKLENKMLCLVTCSYLYYYNNSINYNNIGICM